MRLSLTTLFVSTLAVFSLHSVSAIHPQALSRREHSSSSLIISSRQYRVPHTILDLCIDAYVDLLAGASSHLLGLAPILGPLDLSSEIQLCLCLKDLDIFLDTNVDIQGLVGLLGKNTVSALITALINTSSDTSKCLFPPHAHHTCNKDDPCHYQCDAHYHRVGHACVCAPPYISCNGDCGIFLNGCGSAVPRSLKARHGPITTITEAKSTCKPHQTVCGITGRENTLDFECIDIDTTNDSCGGCMAPHPFPEADTDLPVSGMDCTLISNARKSQCSGQRCIVSECKLGWIPNLARDTCIVDQDSNVAEKNVSSDLVAKIGVISGLVSGLNCAPLQIPACLNSSASVISVLLGRIVDATSMLIASSNGSSLMNNLDALLTVSSLLDSTISICGYEGLTKLETTLGNIEAALLNLKTWCANNVPSGLNLSGLLSGLGLNNSAGAVVSSDLMDQIKSLGGIVVELAGVSSSLPPQSPGSSSMSSSDLSSIVRSIINATEHIVNPPTVSSLLSAIGALVNVNSLASSSLDHCKCVSALGLEPLAAYLAQIANAALRMQDWCDTYPVASVPQVPTTTGASTGASTSISNTDELPIDLGLSDLLGLLRLADAAQKTVYDTLRGGPLTSADDIPLVSAVTAAGGVLNPELVTKLKDLATLATKFQTSFTPSGPDASTLLDSRLVVDVVQKAANLFNSPTVVSLASNIDALVTANSALQTASTNCTCVDMVNHLGPLTDAALELKKWRESNSLVIVLQSKSSPPPPPDTLSAAIGVISPSTLSVTPSIQATSVDLHHLLPGPGLSVGLGMHIAGRQAFENVKDRSQITADVDASDEQKLIPS